MYEQFEATHLAMQLAFSAYIDALDGDGPLNRAFQDELVAAYKALYPRRKPSKVSDFDRFKALPQYHEIRARHTENGKAALAVLDAEVKRLKAELYSLAETLPMPVSACEVLLQTSCGSSYHTQGFGANKYARDAAESVAEKARMHGVSAEVREIATQPAAGRYGVSTTDYGVFALTTELGKMLLSYKPEPGLREQVKRSLQRGANPRVSQPFLPYGYEARVGLDAFGNDVQPELVCAAA